MIRNTLIVNLYGGPGIGKSTTAAWLFYKLKSLGINVEIATEYAKDKVWEESFKILHNQIYVFAKQHHRIKRLLGKVDVIVTDSPIIMGTVYDSNDNKYLKDLAHFEYSKMNNIDFFIERNVEYDRTGRNQTEREAIKLDSDIRTLIESLAIRPIDVKNDESGYSVMLEKVINKLK